MPPSVAYLLEDTTLYGGVKIVLQHANLLHARGYDVRVISRGELPTWFDLRAPFRRVSVFGASDLAGADVVVATFWTTIRPAIAAASGEVVHFCQGFEGSYTHNTASHAEIEAAYGARLPGMVLAPHLGELLTTRFSRPAALVPPPVDPGWRHARFHFRPRRVPRVLVVHPFENDWKGVETALRAVRLLRESGVSCTLVRLSQWPLSAAERAILEPDEFHCHLPPHLAARLARGCDLLLAPSWEQEGFGLPVLEAFASGVPVVASAISAFRWYAAPAALLVPPQRPEELAGAAAALLGDPARWRAARRRGFAVARSFSAKRVADAVEAAIGWVAGGRWRSEAAPQPAWP